MNKALHLQLNDEELAQFEVDANEPERFGHVGTPVSYTHLTLPTTSRV